MELCSNKLKVVGLIPQHFSEICVFPEGEAYRDSLEKDAEYVEDEEWGFLQYSVTAQMIGPVLVVAAEL